MFYSFDALSNLLVRIFLLLVQTFECWPKRYSKFLVFPISTTLRSSSSVIVYSVDGPDNTQMKKAIWQLYWTIIAPRWWLPASLWISKVESKRFVSGECYFRCYWLCNFPKCSAVLIHQDVWFLSLNLLVFVLE